MQNSATATEKRQKSPDTRSARWPFSFNPYHNDNNRFLQTPTSKENAKASTLSYGNPFSVLLSSPRGRIQSHVTIPQTKITKSNPITKNQISSKNLDDQVNTKQVTIAATVYNNDETMGLNYTSSKKANEKKLGVVSKCDGPSSTILCEQAQNGSKTSSDSEIEVPKLLADRNVTDDLIRKIPNRTKNRFSQISKGANIESSLTISAEPPLPKPEFVCTKKQNLQKVTTPASDPRIKDKRKTNNNDQCEKNICPFSSTSNAFQHGGKKMVGVVSKHLDEQVIISGISNSMTSQEKNPLVSRGKINAAAIPEVQPPTDFAQSPNSSKKYRVGNKKKSLLKELAPFNLPPPTNDEPIMHIGKRKKRQGHIVSFEPGLSSGWKNGEDGKSGKQTGQIYRRSQRTKKRKRGVTAENNVSNSKERPSKHVEVNQQKIGRRRRLSQKATRRVATNALVGYLQRHQTIKTKHTR